MDVVLFGITVVSLGLAGTMTALARKAARAEHLRSAARVAALRAAVETEPTAAPAAIAEPIAVGEARVPTPWPPPRPSGVSARSEPVDARSAPPAHAARPTETAQAASPERPSPTTLGDGFLATAAAASPSGGRQHVLALAAVLLFIVAIGGGYWAVFADRAPAADSGAATTSGQALELVSLRHERRGAKLDVVGLVRNPLGGAPIDKLTAVVFLFDRQGGFLSSARTSVDYLTLAPGDETPFVIAMDAPASVARYRVSFRNEAGVVPHIDRRGQEPIAAQAVIPAATGR